MGSFQVWSLPAVRLGLTASACWRRSLRGRDLWLTCELVPGFSSPPRRWKMCSAHCPHSLSHLQGRGLERAMDSIPADPGKASIETFTILAGWRGDLLSCVPKTSLRCKSPCSLNAQPTHPGRLPFLPARMGLVCESTLLSCFPGRQPQTESPPLALMHLQLAVCTPWDPLASIIM